MNQNHLFTAFRLSRDQNPKAKRWDKAKLRSRREIDTQKTWNEA